MSPTACLAEPDKWTSPYVGKIENECRRWLAGSVTHMDDSIGQVCATLDRLGLRDDTLIVFFSDNGGQQSWSSKTQYDGRYAPHDKLGDNRPLRGWKGQLYEGGIRVPALANWPGGLAPRILNDATSVLDLLPTLVAAGGGESQEDRQLEGVDIWPALTGGKGNVAPRELYWKTGGQYALRSGDWKLVQNRKGDRRELFNLAKDPYERTDRAKDEPQRVQALAEALRQQQARDPRPQEK